MSQTVQAIIVGCVIAWAVGWVVWRLVRPSRGPQPQCGCGSHPDSGSHHDQCSNTHNDHCSDIHNHDDRGHHASVLDQCANCPLAQNCKSHRR